MLNCIYSEHENGISCFYIGVLSHSLQSDTGTYHLMHQQNNIYKMKYKCKYLMSRLVSETVYFPLKSHKISITMCVFHIYFHAKIMLQSVAKITVQVSQKNIHIFFENQHF